MAVLTKNKPPVGTLTVEVLREVRGLSLRELQDADLVELRPGQVYRIPSPIRLLKAKLANLREITPMRPQDLQHARLLVPLAHDYLVAQYAQVTADTISSRALINALHELDKVITAPAALATAHRLGLELVPALPLTLATEGLPGLAAFYQHYGRSHPKPKPPAT